MLSYPQFINQVVKPTLPTLGTVEILCFACSCVERMAPLIRIWMNEAAGVVTESVGLGWEACLLNRVPYDDTLHLTLLYKTYEQMLDIEPQGYDDIQLLAENAIRSCTSLIEYAHSKNTKDAEYCSANSLAVIEDLSKFLILQTKIFYSEDDLIESKSFVLEQNKQERDLKTLTTHVLTEEIVQRIRNESQQLGKEYAEIYQTYRATKIDSSRMSGIY